MISRSRFINICKRNFMVDSSTKPMMKAILAKEFGGPEVLFTGETPIPVSLSKY